MTMTMKELAAKAGVSRQAVAAVFNPTATSRVSPATRRRILQIARQYDFVPNQAALQLRGVPNRLVGLIASPRHHGFHFILQSEIAHRLQASGYAVLLSQQATSPEGITATLREFRARRVEGVLALGLPAERVCSPRSNRPVVCCSDNNQGGFDFGFDRREGGRRAGRHFIEHGRRAPAFLALEGGPLDREKHEGLAAAYTEDGGPSADVLYVTCNGTSSATEIARQLRDQGIDALLCGNDYIAAKMLLGLRAAGCRVPDEMAVIGFDGFAFCDYTPVPLATIVQPVRKEAQMAVDLLVERIRKPEGKYRPAKVRLALSLRPSASCGCKPVMADELLEADRVLLLDDDEVSRQWRESKRVVKGR